jgi:hypothetical protein
MFLSMAYVSKELEISYVLISLVFIFSVPYKNRKGLWTFHILICLFYEFVQDEYSTVMILPLNLTQRYFLP